MPEHRTKADQIASRNNRPTPEPEAERAPQTEEEKLATLKAKEIHDRVYDIISDIGNELERKYGEGNVPESELDDLKARRAELMEEFSRESTEESVATEKANSKPPAISKDTSKADQLLALQNLQKENPHYFSDQVRPTKDNPDNPLNIEFDSIVVTEDVKKIQGHELNTFLDRNVVDKAEFLEGLRMRFAELSSAVTKLELQFHTLLKLHNLYDKLTLYKGFTADDNLPIFSLLKDKTEITYPEQEVDISPFHRPETMALIEKMLTNIQVVLSYMDDSQTDWNLEGPIVFKKFNELEEALQSIYHLIRNAEKRNPERMKVEPYEAPEDPNHPSLDADTIIIKPASGKIKKDTP